MGRMRTAGTGEGAHMRTREHEREKRGEQHKGAVAKLVVGYTRFMAIIPCIGLLAASVALMVVTLVATVQVTVEAAESAITLQDLMVEYIEFADFFLLAIVLYIMAVGLYSLFIDDDVPMPHWLEIHDLEDLKEKLIGVIVVVMGVFFLGKLIHGTEAQNLLYIGVGIAAVVLALGYFARYVIIGEHASEPTEHTSTLIVAHPGTPPEEEPSAEETPRD